MKFLKILEKVENFLEILKSVLAVAWVFSSLLHFFWFFWGGVTFFLFFPGDATDEHFRILQYEYLKYVRVALFDENILPCLDKTNFKYSKILVSESRLQVVYCLTRFEFFDTCLL